jgi:hypothetical protein
MLINIYLAICLFIIMKENWSLKGFSGLLGCVLVDVSVGEYALLSYIYPYLQTYFKLKDPNFSPVNIQYLPVIWLSMNIISCPLGIHI